MILGRDRLDSLSATDRSLPLHVFAHQIDDRLHGDATCYLTGVVATHAVSEHEQANIRIYRNGVLIVFADLAGIREPNEAQLVSRKLMLRPAPPVAQKL